MSSVSQEISSKNERDFHSRKTDVVKKIAGDSSWYVCFLAPQPHCGVMREICICTGSKYTSCTMLKSSSQM